MSSWTDFRDGFLQNMEDTAKEQIQNEVMRLVTVKIFGKKTQVTTDVRDKLREMKSQNDGLKQQLKEQAKIIEELQKYIYQLEYSAGLKQEIPEPIDFEEF